MADGEHQWIVSYNNLDRIIAMDFKVVRHEPEQGVFFQHFQTLTYYFGLLITCSSQKSREKRNIMTELFPLLPTRWAPY